MFNQEEYIKKWRIDNREKMLNTMGEYKDKNKDRLKRQAKQYYQRNKGKIKEYQTNNKDKIRLYENNHKEQRNNRMKKYLSNPINRVSYNLRRRLNLALNGKLQSGTIVELLGCDIPTLKQHLASGFIEGMSFDNYGAWHIDHIKPCASFDLSKPEEQEKCFHYTNLRPLWAHDNLIRPRKERVNYNVIRNRIR